MEAISRYMLSGVVMEGGWMGMRRGVGYGYMVIYVRNIPAV